MSQKLVARGIFQVYGSGKATRYEIRRPSAFFRYLEECYLNMAGKNYFVPYLLPRKLMTLDDRKVKLEEVAARIQTAGLNKSVAFVLHTAIGIRGVRHQVFKSREIEILVLPDILDELEVALSLTPIISPSMVRPGKPILQSADVILVFNRLSELIIERYSVQKDGRPRVRDLINLFELKRYPRRGIEASEAFMEELMDPSAEGKRAGGL
jgi:hypothetical protein